MSRTSPVARFRNLAMKTITLDGTLITATAAELNALASTGLSAAEAAKIASLAATAYLPVVEMLSFTQTSAAGTYTGTITVPAGALILDIKVWSTVLWNAGTSSLMDVGDVTDPDGWFTQIDLQATDLLVGEEISFDNTGGKHGAYLLVSSGKRSAAYSASARAVSGIIVQTGTGTAGRTFMAVEYVLPTATAATKV